MTAKLEEDGIYKADRDEEERKDAYSLVDDEDDG